MLLGQLTQTQVYALPPALRCEQHSVVLPLSVQWFRIVVGINRWTDLEPRVAGNTPQNSTGMEVMNDSFVRKLISGYIYIYI